MSISLLIQLGGRSVGDKASVIYHGEGNAQYRAMLIRAPSLKQWLWEAALPQIVSAEIHAYKSGCTGTFWEGLCSSDWIPNKTQAWRLLTVKRKMCFNLLSVTSAATNNIMLVLLCSIFWLWGHRQRWNSLKTLRFNHTSYHILPKWTNQRPVNAHWPDEILPKLLFLWNSQKSWSCP